MLDLKNGSISCSLITVVVTRAFPEEHHVTTDWMVEFMGSIAGSTRLSAPVTMSSTWMFWTRLPPETLPILLSEAVVA